MPLASPFEKSWSQGLTVVKIGHLGRTVSVSIAVCFPLLFIAFNLDLVGTFWTGVRRFVLRLWMVHNHDIARRVIVPGVILAINIGILTAVWMVPLDRGFKAGVTACLIIIEVLMLLGWGMYKLITASIAGSSTSAANIGDSSASQRA